MRLVILHYHILKNAGTTLENILDRNFGERFARLDTEHRDGRIEQAAIVDYLERHPRVEAISSHQIHYPVPQAPGYLFFDWCFLRDPIDRLRSTYDYFRQRPSEGDPLSDAANSLEFAAYIRRLLERFPEQVDSPQTNLLANGAADRETVPEDLPRAIQRMRETVFLGVVDLYQSSIAAGRHRLRGVFPWLDFTEPPANVSRGSGESVALRRKQFRDAVGRTVYGEVARLNGFDFRLLRAARAEVRQRFRAAAPGAGPAPRPPVRAFQPSRLPWALRKDDERKRRMGIFDAAFYQQHHPDVQAAGLDPFRHYVEHGAFEGRKPHRLFDPEFYLRQRPEARAPGVEPLIDFLAGGAKVANPHPLFDCAGEARRFVEFIARGGDIVPRSNSIAVSDVRLIAASLFQRPFFEAVRPDQLRAQLVEPEPESNSR